MGRIGNIVLRIGRWLGVGILYVIAIPAVRRWLLARLHGRASTKVIDVNVKK